MNKLWMKLIFVVLMTPMFAMAQLGVVSRLRVSQANPPNDNCSPTTGDVIMDGDGNLYTCTATNIWTPVIGGGGGSVTQLNPATNSGTITNFGTFGFATQTTTPTLAFSLLTAGPHLVWGNNTGSTAAPSYVMLACGDLSNSSPSCSADTTNAVNITSGTLSRNTTGTAANLSGTPALPNGTTATTQSFGDNTTKLATDAFVLANSGSGSLSGVTGPAGILFWSIASGTATASPASVLDDAIMSGPPVGSFLTPVPTGNALGCPATASGSTWSLTCTLPSTTTAGNLIYATLSIQFQRFCTTTTVSDNVNGTYTPTGSFGGYLTSWYAKNIAGGNVTLTVTATGCSTTQSVGMFVTEISGADLTAPQDQVGQGANIFPTLTITFAPELVIGTFNDYNGTDTLGAVSGWSTYIPGTFDGASGQSFIGVYRTTTVTGNFQPQYSCSGTCNGNAGMSQAISFKGRSTSGASGAWSAQYLRFSQLCPVAFPGLCGLIPSGTQGTTGVDLHIGSPINTSNITSAFAGNDSASTLVTTSSSYASALHCWIYVSCHTTVASSTISPSVLFTDEQGTATSITGQTATCTTAGTGDVSSNVWPIRAKASTTVYFKTTLTNSPHYDAHAVCELAGTQ